MENSHSKHRSSKTAATPDLPAEEPTTIKQEPFEGVSHEQAYASGAGMSQEASTSNCDVQNHLPDEVGETGIQCEDTFSTIEEDDVKAENMSTDDNEENEDDGDMVGTNIKRTNPNDDTEAGNRATVRKKQRLSMEPKGACTRPIWDVFAEVVTLPHDDDAGESNLQQSPAVVNSILTHPAAGEAGADATLQVDRMLIKFIAKESVPLSIVESEPFETFLQALNSNYNLPCKKYATYELLPSFYAEEMRKVKQNVASANAVALSLDGWLNSNQVRVLALSGHFLDENLKVRSKLLASGAFSDTPRSCEVTAWIYESLKKFEIENKIIALVTDDSASAMGEAADNLNIPHVPCFAHHLNALVQEAIENSIQPTVDKVKQVVTCFKNSTEAAQMLVTTQKSLNHAVLKLKPDVPTRWNSTYEMLDRFLKNKCPLIACTDRLKIRMDMAGSDWTEVEQALVALKYFASATKLLSAEPHTTLSHVGFLSAVLLRKTSALLQTGSELVPAVKSLLTGLVAGIKARLQVYRDMDQVWKSMFLDPRVKKAGFQDEPERYKHTYDLILAEMLPLLEQECRSVRQPFKHSTDANLLYGDIICQGTGYPTTPSEMAQDELDLYLNANMIGVERDPLLWWKENSVKFPTLCRLAANNLCIPGTSVPCYRMFSKAGQKLVEKRARLAPKKLHELLFLQCNY
ncbi:zinc finger BED domain-containing protein 1-like isoform X1 [Anopheles stephensi]|uniref:zinc finger BED domain-containing protein 1-like isoform X1 n=2 Tax=Anopheles stephensi TaxID=30069 RepID=UPI0016587B8C|nr:zinc finger BED domain-containing protein 1-like isoform X1 [Anopheles stephensi]